MGTTSKRSFVCLDKNLHAALLVKSANTNRSVSDIVNDAVRAALSEDQEDLGVFQQRVREPTLSYEELLGDLKAHGQL